ncbi:DGQHR domain-containing protein [Clostridium gasigenes]|uniref:DGQHR domain-containing protein n=1 Tax=Clostridium gasigenes TaxID=94869 RepID=UPI001438350E|nr:DGQHR domain-containing protein [Clostridium gasigenes]NKF05689.1 DGQHR domain-containing protein [Clostridium gasigenes]QSW19123.1 DGQHR domain-containing protein [Clostridium gasigenes]
MKIFYIKLTQKNEVFYITKFKASELKNKINFHFREPYSDAADDIEKYEEYIEKLRKKGIEINADDEGVQRRIQIARINKIKKYLEEQDESFFPASVVLTADISKYESFEKIYSRMEEKDFGEVDLPDDIMFQIVDGQHRLAGLFISDKIDQENFEIPAVLLFNATNHTCAKVFTDINGNQTPVNRSGIYDLFDLINDKDENSNKIKTLHLLCKKLNNDPDSPLFNHIKMLGIGSGAISQAFFIQYLGEALKSANLSYSNSQEIYDHLFIYLKCFQRIFKTQWPVIENKEMNNMDEFEEYKAYLLKTLNKDINNNNQSRDYSNYVLKVAKSQLLKTNGFGAVMMLFPYVYKQVEEANYNKYIKLLNRLDNKIDWATDEILIQGTGKKNQKKMLEKMLDILNINN